MANSWGRNIAEQLLTNKNTLQKVDINYDECKESILVEHI
jgi:hypothetical protein